VLDILKNYLDVDFIFIGAKHKVAVTKQPHKSAKLLVISLLMALRVKLISEHAIKVLKQLFSKHSDYNYDFPL